MATWADLDLDPERVHRAHPTFSGVVLVEGEWAFTDGVDPTVPEAKARVEVCLNAKLGRYAMRYGSPEGLLDAIADEPRLASGLQTLLAYGHVAATQFSGRNTGRDVYADDARDFEKRFGDACTAVANTAPAVLGLDASAPGVSVGGSFASIMSLNG